MKLDECIRIAKECGCQTLGEAYDNIEIHSLSLFILDDIIKEMEELQKEIIAKYNFDYIDERLDKILI